MITGDQFFILVDKSRQMFLLDKDIEKILQYLRQNGCTKIDSVRVIAEVKGSTIDDAKLIVHYSKTWEDVQKRDEEILDAMSHVFEEGAKGPDEVAG
jgi:hypothetical protein